VVSVVRPPVIEPVDGTDQAVMDAWLALLTGGRRHDLPDLPPLCPVEHAQRFRSEDREVRAWVLRAGDRTVASAELGLPLRDNLRAGGVNLVVAPDRRRRGLGRLLLDHVAAQARAAGRSHLWMEVHCPLDAPAPGSGFLRSAGARPALADTRRVLEVRPGDPELRRLMELARDAARGYGLVQWTGPTPEPWLDDVAALIARMSTDAPQGELALEPERWDAGRVRARDAADAARGQRTVVTAARGPDGHLVGYTTMAVRATVAGYAKQDDTIVEPAHRGHRLGLWMKLANLELLAAEHPDVRRVGTYNADENRWMVAVNEAMGYRPRSRLVEWQLDLTAGQAGTTAPISAAASGP
jgi:GNAT superfamily N-acetyltransferase